MRIEVPYEKLVTDPHNVRSRLRRLPELADSIHQHGLLENLVVIEIPGSGDVVSGPDFMIKAGARRHAAIGLNLQKGLWPSDKPVPVFVMTNTDGGWEQLVENIQRENPYIWEQGRRFSEYYEGGFKQDEIAARIGKSQGYVSRAIQIAQGLAPSTIELILKNRFDFPDAGLLKLACLKDDNGQPNAEAQRDRAIIMGARRGRRKRAMPDKNRPAKDIVYRRFKNLRDTCPIPLHAEKYVDAVIRYLSGSTPRLSFGEKEKS